MPNTDSSFTQDTPFTDMEIFVGASAFGNDLVNHSNFVSTGAGFFAVNIAAASTAINVIADLSAVLKRTGVFGVDAKATRGYPPFTGVNLPTLKNPSVLPVPKGIQINAVDIVYWTSGLSAAQFGITAVNFVNNAAVNIVTIIPLASNMPGGGQVAGIAYRIPISVANPAFLITQDTELVATLNVSSGGGTNSFNFYGIVLKCSYNFN